jgi:SAM-dependent methyltransferase
MKQPKTVNLSKLQLKGMLDVIVKNPTDIFLSPSCRRYLAFDRWKQAERYIRIHGDISNGVAPGAIEHNRRELEQDSFGSYKRTARLINPLTSLDPIYSHAHQLKVLSIGPRTEMELLHLVAVGFDLANIEAIDLISSSLLIDTGDMHDLPYPDQSFDVVISGWVLNYSSEPQRALDEVVRVCKNNGFLAIGLTYDPKFSDDVRGKSGPKDDEIVGSMHASVEELKSRLGNKLGRIFFQQDPDVADKKGVVMLIGRINHRA